MASLAETAMLFVNQIIKWQENPGDRFERVLWIEEKELVTIEVGIERGIPRWLTLAEVNAAIADGGISIESTDRWLPPTEFGILVPNIREPDGAENSKSVALRDSAWELIEQLVEPPNREIFIKQIRGKRIKARVEETGHHAKVIYAMLRRYWQRGQTRNALLPDYSRCGARGVERVQGEKKLGRPRMYGDAEGVIITDHIRECFRLGYAKYYNNRKKRPLTKVLLDIRADYFCYEEKMSDGRKIPILFGPDELPTIKQFRYWVKKEGDVVESTKAREGKRRHALRYRALSGKGLTRMALGPGSIYQIDSTMADLYLLSKIFEGRLAGRPILYLIIDVWSRLIVGYHLTFAYPSYISACMALLNAACDKVKHCADLGITILPEEWPSCHIPGGAVADRGELKGKQAENWTRALGIKLDLAPPYRADFKGIVERAFRLNNDYVLRWLPGHVDSTAERGDRDTRLDSKFDMTWLRYLVVKWILFHNRNPMRNYPFDEFQMESGVNPVPKDLWAWGVETGRQDLKIYPEETLLMNLLPGDKASVHATGIVYKDIIYTSKRMVFEKWTDKVGISKRRRPVTIAYDPRCARKIYLRSPEFPMEPCDLKDGMEHYAKLSWPEIKVYQKLEKEQDVALERIRDENEQKLNAEIKHAVASTSNKKLAGKSKREKVGGIEATRNAEIQAEHRQSTREQNSPPEKIASHPVSESSSQKDEHTLPQHSANCLSE